MTDLRIAFAGTPTFAATILSALCTSEFMPELVLTQPDRPKGRGRAVRAGPVKQLAEALNLPIAQPPNLRASEHLQSLERLAPDVMVVAAYGLILPARVLALPRLGCINVHASLLPRWRGAAPIERALMAGDRESGVCIMQMDAGLDTGPVLSRQSLAIEPEQTAQSLEQALAELGAELLLETLRNLPAPAQAQPNEGITYAHKLTAEDRIAKWPLDADAIHQQIRALCDRMPVRCTINGAVMQILAARVERQKAYGASKSTPGKLLKTSKDGLFVQCGDDVLVITELKLNRGRGSTMDVAAALNGYPDILRVGTVIDSASPLSGG